MKYIERMRVNLLRVKMGEAEVEGTLLVLSFPTLGGPLGIIKNLGNMV